jgi:hypothetical protein
MNTKQTIYKMMTTMAAAKQWQKVLVVVAFVAVLLGLGWKGYDYYLGTQRAVATIVPYNHTNIGVEEFYVDGVFGGISYPQTGGGSHLCCATIPRRWHPDMKMTVKWQKDGSNVWLSKEVTIQRYDRPGELQVHFLDKDEVRVVITIYGLVSPKNPLHKEFPWGEPEPINPASEPVTR